MKNKNENIINPLELMGDRSKDSISPLIVTEQTNKEINGLKASVVKVSTNFPETQEKYGRENQITINTNNLNHLNVIEPIIIERKNDKRFFQNEKGELCFVLNNKDFVQPICNFIVHPIAEVTVDEGNRLFKKYLIKGKLNGDLDLPQISITAQDFKSSDWIYNKWGIICKLYAVDGAYKFIQEYISEQMLNIPTRYQLNYVGWRWIDGRNVYVHGGGVIGLEKYNLYGNREYTLEFNNKLSEHSSYQRLLDMLDIAKYRVSIPLMAYTILSILNKPFKDAGFEPKFIMFLNGETGSRKTTLAKMYSKIFNRSKDSGIASFKDTKAYLEHLSAILSDSILIVDDLHPTTSSFEKRNMEDTAAFLMRIYGDSLSKGRMNKYMQAQKQFRPQGLCLITGEDVIGGNSTTARFINLEITKNDVNLRKLTEHQQEMSSFSTSLTYFLIWISNNYNGITHHIKNSYVELREKYQDSFTHGRIVESYISLKIAFDFLLKYGESIGMYRYEEAKKMSKQANNIFFELASKHNRSMITQDPGITYLTAIKELVESGKVKLLDKNATKEKRDSIIGYRGDSNMYLIPQLTYNEVKEYWRKLGKEFPVSLQKTNEALDNLGVLDTRYEGNKLVRTVKVSIGENRSRYLILNVDKMNQVLLDNE